ncbi:ester cyclase [Promicromonospora sp. NPDC057138]|uniref:ester cyclase n=1 Tax=Promicromonospora sp. NPDC057138 TaxID=3346031 RepID=UPI0036425BA9
MDELEANKALVRRFYAELDAGNLGAMDELVSSDFVDHDPPPIPDLPAGRDGLKAAFEIFWRSTPGTHEVLDQVAEGDLVVTRIRAQGRFVEDMGPIPATGGELDVTATAVYRVSDGMLTEHWGETDSLTMMQQLGVVSMPDPQAGA